QLDHLKAVVGFSQLQQQAGGVLGFAPGRPPAPAVDRPQGGAGQPQDLPRQPAWLRGQVELVDRLKEAEQRLLPQLLGITVPAATAQAQGRESGPEQREDALRPTRVLAAPRGLQEGLEDLILLLPWVFGACQKSRDLLPGVEPL